MWLDNPIGLCHPSCWHSFVAFPHLPCTWLFWEGFSWQVDCTASAFHLVLGHFVCSAKAVQNEIIASNSFQITWSCANESHAATQQSSFLLAALGTSILKADKKAFKSARCSLQKMMKLQLPHIFQLNQSRKLPSWWPDLQEVQFCMKKVHLSQANTFYMWYFAWRTWWADSAKLNVSSPPIRLRNGINACQTPLPAVRGFAISV